MQTRVFPDNLRLTYRRRHFVAGWVARLRQENPQLTVSTEVQRGSHPYLTADYSAQYGVFPELHHVLISALLA